MGKEKLTEKTVDKLTSLLAVNEPLSKAYILKEHLRSLWDCEGKKQAEAYLEKWIAMAEQSGVKKLAAFAQSLRQHIKELLAYFSHPPSTARVEGINNKIKVLKRKAYGYCDMYYFELKIYSANKLRYSLIG